MHVAVINDGCLKFDNTDEKGLQLREWFQLLKHCVDGSEGAEANTHVASFWLTPSCLVKARQKLPFLNSLMFEQAIQPKGKTRKLLQLPSHVKTLYLYRMS